MNAAIPEVWPGGAAWIYQVGQLVMDVTLHMGAHRSATTTFQYYMRDHQKALAAENVAYWGPKKVRKSVFAGLFRNSTAPEGRNLAMRAAGRVRLHAAEAEARGMRQLLVSDENMLGTCRQNIAVQRLYPAAGERTARIVSAFGGKVRRIVLSIRSQDLWCASAAALTVSRGHPVPNAETLQEIAESPRSWRDVITDIACAAPGVEIRVIPFETHAGNPARFLEWALDRSAPVDTKNRWLNRSPDVQTLRGMLIEQGSDPSLVPDGKGRWMPFNDAQTAQMRENYADDMHWLIAGADGLATLTEDTRRKRADTSLPADALIKGQEYDQGQLQGRMAHNG